MEGRCEADLDSGEGAPVSADPGWELDMSLWHQSVALWLFGLGWFRMSL